MTQKILGGTCFKNPKQPSCVNLFLTLSFQHAISVSDFHNVILIVHLKPSEINWRDYKAFNQSNIANQLQ